MREGENLREKFSLSLDDRQMAALAVAGLLLLGGVFSLGVVVGKTLTARAPRPSSAGDLAALDEAQREETSVPERKADAPVGNPPRIDPAAQKPAAVIPALARKPVVVDPPKTAEVRSAAAVVPLSPPPRDLGAFTVQIGASQDRADAQRLESRARAVGLKPYVVEAQVGNKGLWYRVRVGAFMTKDAANRFRRDVERELRLSAAVMPSR